MSKKLLDKPTRKISNLVLVVALLLPIILYVVYFWRSGVFTGVTEISTLFAPGAYDNGALSHTPGSFAEFLNNTFVIQELNEVFTEPILYAVKTINGSISTTSAYTIYSVCGYLTYITLVYLGILIFKLITFVPCVIISFVNKLSGER